MGKINEKIVWNDKNSGTMIVEETTIIKNTAGEESGNTITTTTVSLGTGKNQVPISDMLKGIETIEMRVQQSETQLKGKEDMLESMGKIPHKSNELVRLQKNLEDLNKINESKKLQSQIDQLKDQLALDRKRLEDRKSILAERPE